MAISPSVTDHVSCTPANARWAPTMRFHVLQTLPSADEIGALLELTGWGDKQVECSAAGGGSSGWGNKPGKGQGRIGLGAVP